MDWLTYSRQAGPWTLTVGCHVDWEARPCFPSFLFRPAYPLAPRALSLGPPAPDVLPLPSSLSSCSVLVPVVLKAHLPVILPGVRSPSRFPCLTAVELTALLARASVGPTRVHS